MEDSRRDVGDARGRSSAGNGGNTVSDDIYKETSGNRGTVGGLTTNILSVCRGEGILGGLNQEEGLVSPRGNIQTTLGHLGRIITEI